MEAICKSMVLYCKSVCVGCRSGTWDQHNVCERGVLEVWREHGERILKEINIEELETQWKAVISRHCQPYCAATVQGSYSQPSPQYMVHLWRREFHGTRRLKEDGGVLFDDLEDQVEAMARDYLVYEMFFDDPLAEGILDRDE